MSEVHYAPEKLKRALALRARLQELVREGTLTQQEANLTIAAAMHLGTPPKKVQCEHCKAIHPIVGVGDIFTCGCSPDKKQSVWDRAAG